MYISLKFQKEVAVPLRGEFEREKVGVIVKKEEPVEKGCFQDSGL